MSLKITVKEALKLPNIRLIALVTSLAVVKFRGMPKAMHILEEDTRFVLSDQAVLN